MGYERVFAFLIRLISGYYLTNRLNLRKDVLFDVVFGGKAFEKERLEPSITSSLQVQPNYYCHHALVEIAINHAKLPGQSSSIRRINRASIQRFHTIKISDYTVVGSPEPLHFMWRQVERGCYLHRDKEPV